MKIQYLKTFVFLFLSLMLIGGCAKDKLPDPTVIDLTLAATAEVNPDRNGRPSPVLIRVYELRSANVFNTADFFALLEQDQTVLGREMTNRWEYQIDPGEQRELDANFQATSGFIGVIAAYRDIERARWRAIAPINTGEVNTLTATADELSISLNRR